jgi:hypothetical protein
MLLSKMMEEGLIALKSGFIKIESMKTRAEIRIAVLVIQCVTE